MKRLSLALILIIAATQKMIASEDSPEAASKFTNAITAAFESVINSGNAVWEHLAQGQAKNTLLTLENDTGILGKSKGDLRVYIQQGNATDESVTAQVEAMKKQLATMKHLLEKFAVELDGAAHPVGETLGVKIHDADTDKVVELDRVVYAFRDHNPQAAIKALDMAITDLGTMSQAITCFQNSITAKKAACDPQTLKPTN